MSTNFNCTYLNGCAPTQVLNVSYALNDISRFKVYNQNMCEYSHDDIQYSYSIDGVCWSCYMSYDEALGTTSSLTTDFYIRIKVAGTIGCIKIEDTYSYDYTTQLASCFEFSYSAATNTSANLYNPYANLDSAISLQQQLNESVAALAGVPIYYFKLTPNAGSKDITFKEYTLMDVEAVKQIKLIIGDGTMPSSRPEFAEYGLDWQTDWNCEITKGQFATAFGMYAQPMEGDLIYIPMMKRMWMVSGAWEEKNESLMWVGTTFTVSLVKYQEKASVDLGATEELVNSFVKNKYEDLFGEDEMNTLDSGTDGVDPPNYAANALYSVFESDATRKYVSCDSISVKSNESTWYKGTMISDSQYQFLNPTTLSKVVYQKSYCGDNATISFIFTPNMCANTFTCNIISLGSIKIKLTQSGADIKLSINKEPKAILNLTANSTYFVVLQWSKEMNLVHFTAYKYMYNTSVPRYKLTNVHYYYDIDNPVANYNGRYNSEFTVETKSTLEMHGFFGTITNIKLFDLYNDNISEIMQMYPTNQHLLINDTARKLVDNNGVAIP